MGVERLRSVFLGPFRPLASRALSSPLGRRAMHASNGFATWAAALPEVRTEVAAATDFRVEFHTAERIGYRDARLDVDLNATPEQLSQAFERIQSVWRLLGETEPHWSVLSAPQFRQESIDATRGEFEEYGRQHAEDLIGILGRHGIRETAGLSALEFGCGVGRTTRWIAESFATVTGYDVSRNHLDIAERELAAAGVANADVVEVAEVADLDRLVTADVVYSVIVLQHNPPIIIDACLRRLLAALTPRGLAVIQIPTYLDGYRFSVDEYLSAGPDEADKMEMHVLPQERVFEIAAQAGCHVVEVFEDTWTNLRTKSMSNTFVIRRPA